MSRQVMRLGVAAVAALAATAAFAVAPAAAKQKCGDRPYQNWTQVAGNAAGVVFVPEFDNFKIWDNDRDGYKVRVLFNYAGVDDKWKRVPTVDDGGQGPELRELSERFTEICFKIHTYSPKYPDSPIVRYKTREDEID